MLVWLLPLRYSSLWLEPNCNKKCGTLAMCIVFWDHVFYLRSCSEKLTLWQHSHFLHCYEDSSFGQQVQKWVCWTEKDRFKTLKSERMPSWTNYTQILLSVLWVSSTVLQIDNQMAKQNVCIPIKSLKLAGQITLIKYWNLITTVCSYLVEKQPKMARRGAAKYKHLKVKK